MTSQGMFFVVVPVYEHLVLAKQHIPTFYDFCIKLLFSGICYLVSTKALVMESLFYVYVRKWCSRASQVAFHDCRKKLQNHVFSRIVNLASTRVPVIAVH